MSVTISVPMDEERRAVGNYSVRELRAIVQGSAPNPEMETYTGRFCRLFSVYSTRFLLLTPLSPNQITVVSTVIAFLSFSVFFLDETYWWAAPVLYFFSVVLDGSDGEVARFRQQRGGYGGGYTEPVSHDFQYGFLFLIAGTALVYTHGFPTTVLLAAAIAATSKLVLRGTQERFCNLRYAGTGQKQKELQQVAFAKRPLLLRVFSRIERNIFSSTGILPILLIFALLKRMDFFLYLYATGFFLLLFAHFLHQVRSLTKQSHS